MAALSPLCPLCAEDGGVLIFQNEQLRIIHVGDANFPAFYRVVWMQHMAEFSDLTPAERETCMNAVVAVEQILRTQLQPTKVNLAALGNVVPHLHWHVIARFDWDSHFPAPVWAAPERSVDAEKLTLLASRCLEVNQLIAQKMAH